MNVFESMAMQMSGNTWQTCLIIFHWRPWLIIRWVRRRDVLRGKRWEKARGFTLVIPPTSESLDLWFRWPHFNLFYRRYFVYMVVFRLLLIHWIISRLWIDIKKCHMKGLCVIYYGLTQMIVMVGVFHLVVQAILLVKIFLKLLIKETDYNWLQELINWSWR